MVNMGYGTHLSGGVAAARAITEAAQSRLTFIYGVSEELAEELPQERSNTYYKIYNFFDTLAATANWQNLKNMAGDNLSEDYTYVLQSLASAGYQNIFRVNLTRDPFKIPVVKVFVSGLGYNPAITG